MLDPYYHTQRKKVRTSENPSETFFNEFVNISNLQRASPFTIELISVPVRFGSNVPLQKLHRTMVRERRKCFQVDANAEKPCPVKCPFVRHSSKAC